MRSPSTTPAAFGFLLPNALEHWIGFAQKPFRPCALWLWGEPGAALQSIRFGIEEQLAGPLPFEALARPWVPVGVAHLLLTAPAPDLGHLVNASCKRELAVAPRIEFPTAGVGEAIELRWHGAAHGILLVGDQLD
jgi:hypothetical protein